MCFGVRDKDFFNASEYGHKIFYVFIVQDMNFLWKKSLKLYLYNILGWQLVTPIDLDTRCAIFEDSFLAGKSIFGSIL